MMFRVGRGWVLVDGLWVSFSFHFFLILSFLLFKLDDGYNDSIYGSCDICGGFRRGYDRRGGYGCYMCMFMVGYGGGRFGKKNMEY